MADIESKYELDVSQVLSALDAIDSKIEGTHENIKKLGTSDPFKDAVRGASDFDKELLDNVKSLIQLEATAKVFREEIQRLTEAQKALNKEREKLEAGKEYDDLTKQLEIVTSRINILKGGLQKMEAQSKKTATGIGGIATKIKEMVANSTAAESTFGRFLPVVTKLFGGLAIVAGVAGVALHNIKQRAKEYESSLLAVLNSQKDVTKDMDILDDIANELNVNLSSLVSAYGILVSQGLKPTREEMTRLGELAKEAKVDVSLLADAVVKAGSGQLNDLKKLGFQAVKEGDKIKISFRGVTKEFKQGSDESVKAIASIGGEIEKLQSSSGVGRLDILDKLSKGMNDVATAAKDAGDTTDKFAYPAFDRIFRLFSNGKKNVLELAESLGVWLQIGLEHIANDASIVASGFIYLFDIFDKGLMRADLNWKAAKQTFKQNREEIFKLEKEMQARIGTGASGELTGGTHLQGADLAAQKKQRDALLKAEKDLQDALMRLKKAFSESELEQLKVDKYAYLKKKAELDIEEIEIERQKYLKLKQIAAGAKNGKFDKDGRPVADKSVQLSQSEQNMFDARKGAVNDRYFLELGQLELEKERKITEAISTEYQKQLQQVEYKYIELFKLSEKDGYRRVALEKQKAKELNKIELENQLQLIEKQNSKDVAQAEIDVYEAQIKGRIDLETQARRKLLTVELEYQAKKLAMIEKYGGEGTDIQRMEIQKLIAQINAEIAQLDRSSAQVSIFQKLLNKAGLGEDAIGGLKEFSSQFGNILSELYQTQFQLTQRRISRLDSEISKKKEQVDKEKELNQKGVANNLSIRQKELQELQKQRERAIKDQQRLQKIQIASDSITQASSLITASTKIFSAFASIPVAGVPLAIAAIGLMWGAFAAAKVKAFQLAKESVPQYGDGGEVGGRLHKDGGTLIEAEKGEYVTNRRSTEKYRELIEAINYDNEKGIMDYLLKDVLNGTGVGISEESRKETIKFMQDYYENVARAESENSRLIRETNELLKDIRSGTDKINDSQIAGLGPDKYIEKKGNTTIIREVPHV